MMTDLDLLLSNDNGKKQIISQVEDWQTSLTPFFEENEEYANCYRLIESVSKDRNILTRTRVGETIRSTEALTTSIYRMLTAQEPNYDLVSMNSAQTSGELYAAHLQLRYQDNVLKWKRKLLRSLRGLVLFGTQIVETPWISVSRFGRVTFEGLDFIPRSLLQCAFDPHVLNVNDTRWCAFIDYVSDDWLRDRAEEDPDHWSQAQVEAAVGKTYSDNQMSSRIMMRRQRAGYKDGPKNEVITFYGRLRDFPREDKRLWVVRIINEDVIVSAYGNPSPTGNLPMKAASYVEFENEPLGYGVGRLGRISQKHLDGNRIRYIDVATMASFNMWLKSTMSQIKTSDMRFRPLGVVEGNDITEAGIRPMMPNIAAVEVGLKMEELLRNEFQGNVGSGANLQAQVTDASATEASIAQNEAIRRLSVVAEDIGESYIRDYQLEKHEHNIAWLETDQYISFPGIPPQRVNRQNMAQVVGIFMKIVTDKDYRPERLKHLMNLYQILTSVRSRPNILVDDTEILNEIIRSLDADPRRLIRDQDNLAPQTVLNYLMNAKQQAGNASQELGGPVAEDLDAAGIPGVDTQETPVGTVAVSANG